MIVQRPVGLSDYGVRNPAVTDDDDGMQVMGDAAECFALGAVHWGLLDHGIVEKKERAL